MVTLRRQRPICTTTGTSTPTGTFLSVKSPFESVSAAAIGAPEGLVPHLSHVMPLANGASSAFGM